MKPQGHVPASAPPGAHEGADLHVGAIVRAGAFMAVTLVFLILMLLLMFHHLESKYAARTSEAAPLVTAADLPPAPRPQTEPLRDLAQVRAEEDLHLTRYAWVDRTAGIAQIPIERAMVLWLPTADTVPPGASPLPVTELQMRQEKAQEGSHAP